MIAGTIERARGRWREILPRLGVDTQFLTNKHGPCPNCGGKDRFRFDDKNGDGTYYCNQCGPGCGILLIRKLHGWDHKRACAEVDKIIGNGGPKLRPAAAPDDAAKRAAAIERLWQEAHYPDVVDAYLKRRGLSVTSEVLRGIWRCPYYDGPKRIGTFPAVLAPIRDASGRLQSLQRIYTADLDGLARKKVMSPIDTIAGCAVRLFDPGDELGVAEGVENALAAHQLFGIPVWAALNAENLKRLDPPLGVSRLHVFADNDESYVGQEAAYALARRLSVKGFPVEVHVPADVGIDWLDVLTGRQPR
jgi:putative DNA primase/helicase